MKKTYVSPLATEVNVEAEQMLAASIGTSEETVDPGQSWSNNRRGEWGNLWK